MERILLGLFVSLVVGVMPQHAYAASPAVTGVISSHEEVHQYSILVKENGSANAFLLVSNLGMDGRGGSYRLTLPVGAQGPVKAWYVDEGILQKCVQPFTEGMPSDAMYIRPPCYESVRTWVPIGEVVQEGGDVSVVIPKTKGHVSLGMAWNMSDVTDKKWWGRTVTIVTPVVDSFVSYTNVSVDFPDGLYIRDKAEAPVRWGDMESGIMVSQPGSGMDEKMAFTPEVFDRIGGAGDVVKGSNNLTPGESYEFTLMTATARWKLFASEIATMVGVTVLLTIVLSLLLRLLIGRKPFWWYLSIVALLFLFAALVFWLIRMFGAVFPRGEYPVMMKASDVGIPSTERIESPPTAY